MSNPGANPIARSIWGSPAVCVARSTRRIGPASWAPTVTESASRSATGVSRVVSPRTTASASARPVSTFEMEPIS